MLFVLKSKIRNTIYHFKTANWDLLKEYKVTLGGNMISYIFNSWKYGASFEDYYELGFNRLGHEEKKTWITTSLRHEITRQVNDPKYITIFKDKVLFSEKFHNYLGRKIFSFDQINVVASLKHQDLPPRIVIKDRFGQAGKGLFFPEIFKNWNELKDYIEEKFDNPNDLVIEEFIEQHEELKRLYNGSVNTLRVVTFLNGDNVEIWGTLLRIGVESNTDNLATGGIAASVDLDGIIRTKGVYKNPLKRNVDTHPKTKQKILGFKVPYFQEAINVVKDAAILIPEVKSIGWDIAITKKGPCIIEGNDNWCKSLLQLPKKQGMREIANKVCNMYQVYR